MQVTQVGNHKFQVGQEVRLPGQQVKSTGYGFANKFAWDAKGTVQELGWSKPGWSRERVGWEPTKDGGRKAIYQEQLVSRPMYKVDGKWYSESQVKKA